MGGGKGRNGLLPNSLRIISSCLKTVSSNAGSVASTVRSAGASLDVRDQVLWVGFDKLESGPASFKHVLLLGYTNGFQVLDVEDASNVCELVSKRDGPVTFLQMVPIPAKSDGSEGFRASHPLVSVVAGDETNGSGMVQGGRLSAFVKENASSPKMGNCISTPTVVRFYSLKSHGYVHVLRFRSAVYIVRCSPRIVAVVLAAQIYCFDAVTLENKFSVLTYPFQGAVDVNIGYGPMAVGPRWLAYASNNPLLSNTGRLSPQNLTPSPGVSPSTSPGSGSLVARYAMESGKHLASGIINLGDIGYKTFSKYCHDLRPDGSNSPLSMISSRRLVHPSEADNAGMVVIKDFVSKDVISQFRAHTSPISALCFDPSGTLLVTASVQGHNINVFRIMPVRVPNGSTSARYAWTSSHVHLYKLYRGLTTAICFYVMNPSMSGGDSATLCAGGEIEIEKLPVYEVEIRRKDLLPVFEQFRGVQTDWRERGHSGGTYQASSSESNQGRDSSIKDPSARHSKPASHAFGSNNRPYGNVSLLSMESSPSSGVMLHSELSAETVECTPPLIPRKCSKKDSTSYHSEHPNVDPLMDGCLRNKDSLSSTKGPNNSEEAPNACITSSISHEQAETGDSHNTLEFTQYFHEGYSKVSEINESTETVTDADSSSSHYRREKPEEDGDDDDMLGCAFAFSEEG